MTKDIVIFVNAIRPWTFQAFKEYEAQSGRAFKPVVLVNQAIKDIIFERNGQNNLPEKVEVATADFSDARSVREALAPYQDRIFAVTSQFENCIQELRELLPYLPYLPMPSEKSLEWSTEKKLMRIMLEAYDPDLTPGYIEVSSDDEETVQKIEATLSYPLIIKPSGLEGSLLVTYVGDGQELRTTLKKTMVAMQKSYDTWVKRQKPMILIEEFMDGDMYSIDVYVGEHGECRYTPPVEAITGRKAGYEDFFGYRLNLPSGLDETEIEKCQQAATKACHAVGLRSIVGHVELMKTPKGWKIIELGPRIGGYRYEMYDKAYGINHIVNDIRNRAGEEPDIPTKLKNYVSVFDFYARSEGILKAVHGLEETKALASFQYMTQNVFEGEEALFAKNGGDVAVHIMLAHPDEMQLEADVKAMEAAIVFAVVAN
jgi:hypothetical protein